MRDKRRIKRILGKLERLWSMSPDSRFGQVLCNWIYKQEAVPFYEEDYVLEKRLDESLEKLPKCFGNAKPGKAEIENARKINKNWKKTLKEAEKKWMDDAKKVKRAIKAGITLANIQDAVNGKVRVCVRVSGNRITKNGNVLLDIEDDGGKFKAVASKRNESAYLMASLTQPGDEVAIKGKVLEPFIIIETIEWQDPSIAKERTKIITLKKHQPKPS